MNLYARFEERLKDIYFDMDTKRMFNKRVFDWIKQQPSKYMGPNKLLKKFEKKCRQLSLSKKCLLEVKKSKLFLQGVDEALEDILFFLL